MSKLIIKAANGAVGDFPVDVPEDWTVLELKGYLQRNYPTKPEVASQKLVCGGKLLQDTTKVTEVVSSASGNCEPPSGDPLVVHLVVYDRSMSAPAVTSASRSVHSSSTRGSPSLSTSSSRTETQRGREPAGVIPPPGVNEPLLDNQGLRFRMGAANVAPNHPNVQNMPMFMPGGGAYPYGMAPPPQFYMSPYGQMYANQFQQWYNAYYGPREGVEEQPDQGGGGEPHPLDLPVNDNARGNEEDLDDDADEVNAPGGVGMMGGGAGVGGAGMRQRDMVDYLYMFMMISFLVFVAYVTNSLGRLLIFTGGVVIMLLNQGGFFTLQRRRVAVRAEDLAGQGPQQNRQEAGNVPRPQDQVNRQEADNVPPRPQDQEMHRQEQGDGRRVEVDGDAEHELDTDDDSRPNLTQGSAPPPPENPPAQNVPPAPRFLNTLYVFIKTFFTSLVPQQRPELELN